MQLRKMSQQQAAGDGAEDLLQRSYGNERGGVARIGRRPRKAEKERFICRFPGRGTVVLSRPEQSVELYLGRSDGKGHRVPSPDVRHGAGAAL